MSEADTFVHDPRSVLDSMKRGISGCVFEMGQRQYPDTARLLQEIEHISPETAHAILLDAAMKCARISTSRGSYQRHEIYGAGYFIRLLWRSVKDVTLAQKSMVKAKQ